MQLKQLAKIVSSLLKIVTPHPSRPKAAPILCFGHRPLQTDRVRFRVEIHR